MHGGNAARQRAQKRVVAKTTHATHALAHATHLVKSAQGAGSHSVGRARDKRNIGGIGKQLARSAIARVERKRAQANQGGIERVTRGAQAGLKTATAVITGRAVLFGNSDVGDLAIHPTRKRTAELKGSLVIVVIDARRALDMLADQHNGYTARLNRATVLVGDHSCHQNNAVNRVVLE